MKRAVQSAIEKKLDIQCVVSAAVQYIEHIISYPVQNETMLKQYISDLFTIEQISTEMVPGECASTEYYCVVLRKTQ